MKPVAKVELGTGQMAREFVKPRRCHGCGEKRLVQRAGMAGYLCVARNAREAFRRENVQKDSLLCRICFAGLVPEAQTNIFGV